MPIVLEGLRAFGGRNSAKEARLKCEHQRILGKENGEMSEARRPRPCASGLRAA